MDISLLIRVDARQTQLVTSLPEIPIILQLYRLDALTSCTGVLMIDRHSISSTHHYEKWKLLYMCFRQHVTTIILGCRWWLLLQTPHILHEYSLVAQIPTVKTPKPQSFIYTYIHTKYVYIYIHCIVCHCAYRTKRISTISIILISSDNIYSYFSFFLWYCFTIVIDLQYIPMYVKCTQWTRFSRMEIYQSSISLWMFVMLRLLQNRSL